MASLTASKPVTAYDLMDGMRALAAIMVLISHERNILFLDAPNGLSIPWSIFYFITGFGHQSVMIFFVLSGYWITKTVARRSAGGDFAWPDYAIDRLSRLWIVLLPALALGGIFDFVGRYGTEAPIYLGLQGTNTITWDVGARLSLIDFVGSLIFIQGVIVDCFGSNGALWSLANEFWYYVWFPPLYLLLRGSRPSIAASLVVLVTAIAFRSMLPGFACWLFGSILFYATRSPIVQRPSGRAMGLATAGASLLFLGVLILSRTSWLSRYEWIEDVLVSGSFALFLFVLIGAARTYPEALRPLCRYGAGSSYSLYVVHFPLIVLLSAMFLTPSQRLPPSGGLLLSFVGLGFVAIVYGYAVSAMTEANTPWLRRWLKEKWVAGRSSGRFWRVKP